MRQTFETPGPLRLAIDIPAGEIELIAGAGTQTVVDLEVLNDERSDPEDVRVELHDLPGGGHELVVEAPRRKSWTSFLLERGGYSLRVACPEGASARVRSKSADVRGRGRFSTVDVASASGEIAFEQVDDEAQVKTASGDVELGRVGGDVTVHSASGDVQIASAGGALQANTVSGDLSVRDARGDVRANTVSGDLRLDAVLAGSVQAHSVSGDVRVGVRRGSRVYVDCTTVSGDTSSELELSGGPVGDEGPLVELRIKTVSGDIAIARAAAVSEEVSA